MMRVVDSFFHFAFKQEMTKLQLLSGLRHFHTNLAYSTLEMLEHDLINRFTGEEKQTLADVLRALADKLSPKASGAGQ
ncbi:hypothetical protein [Paraburkholderia graminis]